MAGPDYEEARDWIVMLQAFTATDLARSMAIHRDLAQRFILRAQWHGIAEDTGQSMNGTGPAEPLYAWVPLPPGPRRHPHGETPEAYVYRTMGGDPLRVPRGRPVRLVDHQDRRQKMQVAGGAARKMRDRDRAYDRMMQAVERRREKNRQKALDKIEERARRKRDRQRRRLEEVERSMARARTIRERLEW